MKLTVKLGATPRTGTPPLTVTFSGKITHYVGALEWLLDFKDGAVEWGQPPAPDTFTVEHTYQNLGTYEAVLGAHDAIDEASARVTIELVEKKAPPKFSAGAFILFLLLMFATARRD